MKNPLLATSLLLSLAAPVMAAELTINGRPDQGATISWSLDEADTMGFARQRYALGSDWSGTTRVHIEFDGSAWPGTELTPFGYSIRDLWQSSVTLSSSANNPFMTLHPLLNQTGSICQGNGGCVPLYQQYGADFDSLTPTDVLGSATATRNLLSMDFDVALQSGVEYYLFVSTWGSNMAFFQPMLPYTIEITSVPLPASAWLLGSSLLGLVGLRRRKRVA